MRNPVRYWIYVACEHLPERDRIRCKSGIPRKYGNSLCEPGSLDEISFLYSTFRIWDIVVSGCWPRQHFPLSHQPQYFHTFVFFERCSSRDEKSSDDKSGGEDLL